MAAYPNQKILVISSDVKLRRQVSDIAKEWFAVLSTADEREGLSRILSDARVTCVVTDHTTAHSNGVAVLEKVRASRPAARRVLLAEADDFASLIVGLHSGAIEYLVHKPISPVELRAALQPPPGRHKLSA
jgi:DNA-binding response OmpR family regulator